MSRLNTLAVTAALMALLQGCTLYCRSDLCERPASSAAFEASIASESRDPA